MGSTTPPRADGALLGFSLNFKTRIALTPTDYGLTTLLSDAYGDLHDAFAADLAACEPGIRTKSAVVAKNQSRKNLVDNYKLLANLINGTASVTNAQKTELGMNVRADPSPNPIPSTWPILVVKSVNGWTVNVTLKDADSGKRGKPPFVFGASIFSFVGENPPGDISQYKFEGNTGKTQVAVNFPSTLAAGTKVYLTAFWFNGSKASGAACPPVSTHLQGGAVALEA